MDSGPWPVGAGAQRGVCQPGRRRPPRAGAEDGKGEPAVAGETLSGREHSIGRAGPSGEGLTARFQVLLPGKDRLGSQQGHLLCLSCSPLPPTVNPFFMFDPLYSR